MVRFNSHKDLVVWQESINLASMIFQMTDLITSEDKEKIGHLMQKAAIGISVSIAEGPSFDNQKEFIGSLRSSIQKLVELDSLLALGRKLGIFSEDFELDEQINKVERMVIGLIRSLVRPPMREKSQIHRNQTEI